MFCHQAHLVGVKCYQLVWLNYGKHFPQFFKFQIKLSGVFLWLELIINKKFLPGFIAFRYIIATRFCSGSWACPALTISLDSNVRIVGFRRFYFANTDQNTYVFFVVLIGFRWYLNVRIVGFCGSKNLTKMTVPVGVRTFDPKITIHLLLHCFTSHLIFTLLLLYLKQIETDNTDKNDNNRHFLHKKPTKSTNFDKKRRFLRHFRRIFSSWRGRAVHM